MEFEVDKKIFISFIFTGTTIGFGLKLLNKIDVLILLEMFF